MVYSHVTVVVVMIMIDKKCVMYIIDLVKGQVYEQHKTDLE